MNKALIYTFLGLLTAGAIASTAIEGTQAQSSRAQQDPHHPFAQATPSRRGTMMQQVDRHFMTMMIHHQQEGVEMAELALSRTKNPDIKNLAETIKKEQPSQIQRMRTWYKEWYDTEAPATPMAGMGMMGTQNRMGEGMNQGMMKMPMHLETLQNASDFDREFIRQMSHHQQMGVMMAQMAADSATRPEIRDLAQSIIKTQMAQIEQMQQWSQAK
jgi:uncharacterized protein (DUF305 family)